MEDYTGQKRNCLAICKVCKQKNIYYSILGGWYVYYCLNCKKYKSKFELDIDKGDKDGTCVN